MYTIGHFLVLYWGMCGRMEIFFLDFPILQGKFFLDFNCKSAFIMIQSQEIGANPLDGYHTVCWIRN